MISARWVWLSLKVTIWTAWTGLIGPGAARGDYLLRWTLLLCGVWLMLTESMARLLIEAARLNGRSAENLS